MRNRIMQVASRCEMSGKAVIRMDLRCATQEMSLLWSILRMGSVSALEGYEKKKTGKKVVGRVELEQDQYTSCLEVVLDRGWVIRTMKNAAQLARLNDDFKL